MEIRALRPSDERESFQSGDDDLDRFLRRYAGQNQFRHHLGTTYVAVDDSRIVGYVTLAPSSIEAEKLSAAQRKSLPSYPLPILRLARMAVDQSVQNQGLGSELLRFVFTLALRMGEELGCIGVAVDAKPGAVRFYERLGFVALDTVEGRSDSRPQPALLFLPLSQIRAAVGPAKASRAAGSESEARK